MKIFLSWSGNTSKEVSELLAGWIPSVLQEVDIYISVHDIEKGERWLDNVSTNLSDIDFGILAVTPENITAAWLLFEAGALSKNLEKSRVIPLLCGITDSDLTRSPLAQFQYAKLDKQEISNVISSINRHCERSVNEQMLLETFDMWWPKFEEAIAKLDFSIPSEQGKDKEEVTQESRLERLELSVDELLHHIRRIGHVEGQLEDIMDVVSRGSSIHNNLLRPLPSGVGYGLLSNNVSSDADATGYLNELKGQSLGDILGSALDYSDKNKKQ